MTGGGKRKAGEDAENMAISKRAALGEITNNTGGNTPPPIISYICSISEELHLI